MFYPEGMMHKKVNIWLAALIIAIIALSAALAISAKAALPGIGITVISPPIKCVQDTLSPTCYTTCPICGDLVGICNGLFEVKAKYLSGKNILYKNSALCTPQSFPPNGGSFRPGGFCLGNVIGNGPHTLINFGCSK